MQRRPSGRNRAANTSLTLFAALLIALTLGVVAITAALIRNPSAAADLFPGLRQPTPTLFMLATPGPLLPPTWTPSPTAPPPSPTPLTTPLWTPLPTYTLVDEATLLPVPIGTGETAYPFRLQDEVTYQANTNSEGCNWMSIAGQVLDLNGNPVLQVGVEVRSEGFEQFVWAGSATAFGPSGYEVFLNDSPYVQTWHVRLLNFNTLPISEVVEVTTRSSCQENVVLVNFVQYREWAP